MKTADRIAAHIRHRCAHESSGHDWHHIARVRRMACWLAEREGADPEIVELAALVHDIADWKFTGGDETVGPRRAQALLLKENVPADIVRHVVEIVETVSFKGAGVATPMRTLEGQCVQDADRLDAIGAIGIARCFAYGGHKGRVLHDPDVPPVMHGTPEAYRTAEGGSLNHFYEKLFLLKDRMNTESARLIAEERHRVMQAFVDQFLAEWTGIRELEARTPDEARPTAPPRKDGVPEQADIN